LRTLASGTGSEFPWSPKAFRGLVESAFDEPALREPAHAVAAVEVQREAIVSGPEKKVLDLRPIFGLQATITTPTVATDGAYFEIDDVLESGGHTTNHYHPAQEETFEVLDGTLELFRDGGWHKVPAGESSTVPRGATHAFRNASETPVRFLNTHRPALTFQEFLETVDRLIRAGKIKGRRDLRSGIYLSMAAVELAPSVSVKPPQMLLRWFAFIGRRLGYRLE
jgi:quercetin dioxygenase-like cupin family protein